jgi:hypothetical protein
MRKNPYSLREFSSRWRIIGEGAERLLMSVTHNERPMPHERNLRLVKALQLLQNRLVVFGNQHTMDSSSSEDVAADIVSSLVRRCAADASTGQKVITITEQSGLPERFRREMRSRLQRRRHRPLPCNPAVFDCPDRSPPLEKTSDLKLDIQQRMRQLPANYREVVAALLRGERKPDIARTQKVAIRTVQLWLRRIREWFSDFQ